MTDRKFNDRGQQHPDRVGYFQRQTVPVQLDSWWTRPSVQASRETFDHKAIPNSVLSKLWLRRIVVQR